MKFIGITGGVGAGKSKLLTYLQEQYGAKIVLADQVAAELLEPEGACYQGVAKIFEQDDVLLADATFDRKKIAQIIFSDQKKREAMNGLIHPQVKQKILSMVEKERQKGEVEYFVLEAALLLEDHYDELVDEVWYIYASETTRSQRLREKRGYDEKKIQHLFAIQHTEETFREKADVIIDNDKSLDESLKQIDAYFAKEKR